tara:strand:+ start:2517 stop:4139 length:1623 start_codon:yes stop_codon:yes gene_type:complete
MSNLSPLHRGIKRVRRFRSIARLGVGLAQWVTAVGWFFLATFGLDWLAKMDAVERIVLLAIEAVLLIWLFKKYLLPAFVVRESLIGIATKIESHQNVHSDLVAALQFNNLGIDQFGSEQLRNQVVEDTGRISSQIDYLYGFSRPELWKSLGKGFGTIVVIVAIAVSVPDYFNVFLQRMALGVESYPTKTVILSLESVEANAVIGRPITFVVRVDKNKVMPAEGVLKILGKNDAESELMLMRIGSTNEYSVTLPRVIDEFSVTAFVGDDVGETKRVEVLQVPRIELEMKADIPAYAVDSFNVKSTGGRIRSVLAGSNVHPVLRSTNNELKSASIQLGEETFELKNESGNWKMPVEDHPLIGVMATTKYQISVTDTNGISPDRPITGILQVRPDQNPRIAAATVINLVLSGAAPRIKFRAIDDFGIDTVAADITITRGAMETSDDTITRVVGEPESHAKQIDNTIAIELADFGLEIGDTVLVTLQVTDYRGQQPGVTIPSDPIEFMVTSRANFLAAMRDIDSETDEKLDQIIKAQLGVGDRQ